MLDRLPRRHRSVNCNICGFFVIAVSLCGILGLGVVLHCSSRMGGEYDSNRTEIYEKMAADARENGAAFLSGGATSQSLKLSDIFSFENGRILPVHKPANPPVRAAVLYLSPQFSGAIMENVKNTFGSYFSGIWYQDPQLYHFSLFHASHHLEAVVASSSEIEAEMKSIEEVAKTCYPLQIQLERVILTSTGVLIGCWQVLRGTDPFTIRNLLKEALPNAPKQQLYNPMMLHSSFARILPPSATSTNDSKDENSVTSSVLEKLVSDLNQKLHNFQARIDELWFVEELDILALALNGRMKIHKFPFSSS